MPKIIAVTNQKGGVGKTTTAVNLAAALAYKNKRVLLIDSDPQGNASSGVGIEKDNVSLYDCLSDPKKTKDAIIRTKYKNLSVIPSSYDLSAAEIELATEENREFFLKKVIDKIKKDYDYIIIDSPPSLGMITLNILTASDSVLIPIQCEYYALEGLTQIIQTIKLVKKEFNKSLDIEGILATMFDVRTNLSVDVLNEITNHFPDKVYNTKIPRNVRLSEAPSFGEPIIKYDITSKGAESYFSLAREVIENNEGRK